jgi:hypothetical protein
MNLRDLEYIENRLMDPGPATETCERLRNAGMSDLADDVMEAAKTYLNTLRVVRYEMNYRLRKEQP